MPGFTELEEKFGASFPQGTVPPNWCHKRFTQTARVEGIFADVAHSNWIAKLLKDFPYELRKDFGYPWVDQSTVYQDKSRQITQWISRVVYESGDNYSGIYYSSKLGSNFSNWAIFEERAKIAALGDLKPLDEADTDLLKACELLEIKPPTGARTLSGL